MKFDLSTEQHMLKDAIDKLLMQRYDFAKREEYARMPAGWSRELWEQYAQMGLLAIPFAEEDGGLGGGSVDLMIAAQSLGRALVLEPYFATVILAGSFLRLGANSLQRAAIVPALISGNHLLAFAHIEPGVTQSLHTVHTTAHTEGSGWRLNGNKSIVLHGDCADSLIVTARVDGAAYVPDGIGLFIITPEDQGVTHSVYTTQDGRRAADLSLQNVYVSQENVLGPPGQAWPLMEQVFDIANTALCAEALGVMESTLALTLDYLTTRKQFGSVLGTFQSLQHQAVDMMMSLEQARSMTLFATAACSEPDVNKRRQAVSGAKALVCQSARLMGQTAIQLHGGIGMTDEYKLGHDFKRLAMIEAQLGDGSYHRARLARAGGYIASRQPLT